MKQSRTKLPHSVIVKAPGLLPMLYTPREISEELDIPENTLRDWLQAGAPSQRDSRNHIWINGESFSIWVNSQKKPRTSSNMNTDEAYCLRCNQVTRLVNPQVQHVKGNLSLIKGICPKCGKTINRGANHDRTPELSQNQRTSQIS